MKDYSKMILDEITNFYIESNDCNGIPATELCNRFNISSKLTISILKKLVIDKKINLTFMSVFITPHIKAFKDLPQKEQIKKLSKENLGSICVYPSTSVIKSKIDLSKYDKSPFTKMIFLGKPQLKPIYFEFHVLERYYQDPRYNFKFEIFGGYISLSDKFYKSSDLHNRDKTFLQSFGLGYKKNKSKIIKVIVVVLRYLSNLTSEHQQYWESFILNEKCYMSEGYYHTKIIGEWVDFESIYTALLEEQIVINDMSKLIGRPNFFKKTFDDENRPKEFCILLRPTKKNYFNFAHILDKMLSENINKKFFLNDVPTKEKITHKNGDIEIIQRNSISILNEWIRKKIKLEDESVYDLIIEPLREIRDLRSKKSHEIQEDDFDYKYHDLQDKLIDKIYTSLRYLRMLFANHPKIKNYRVPDWLFEGKIKKF